MRSVSLLLAGMALVGVGVALFIGDVGGRWVIGPVLVLAGLALKAVGLLVGGPEGPGTADDRVTTLGGARVERPRAGIPTGRASLRTRHRARPGAAPTGGPAGRTGPASVPRRQAS